MNNFKLGFIFAYNDIRQRYRRSFLGPWWITISTLILVATLSIIFSVVFKSSSNSYIGFLSIGIIIWRFIEMTLKDFCECFSKDSQMLKQININKSFFIYRTIIKNLIILVHNFVIIIFVIFIFDIKISYKLIFLLPGIILLINSLLWIGVIFSIICSRFKDFTEIITNLLQVIFYLTPIIWSTDIADGRYFDLLINLNPFYHMIELVRSPILSSENYSSFIIVFIINMVGTFFSYFFFKKYENKIIFWV